MTAFVDRWSAEPLANHGWLSAQWKDNVMVNDLQAVLEICRDSGEPLRAAGDVCSLLRDRLGACIVSVYGAPMERGRLAQAGLARFDSAELARRTLETGTVVRPTPVADGIEAAAPVLYAGQRIGAVTCRWTIDRGDCRRRRAVAAGRCGHGAGAARAGAERACHRRTEARVGDARAPRSEPDARRAARSDSSGGGRAVPRAHRRGERQRQGARRACAAPGRTPLRRDASVP